MVELLRKDGTSLQRWVRGDGSFLAANDPRVHFGLGAATGVSGVQVRWSAGGCEFWNQTMVNRILTLREGSGQACPSPNAQPVR